MFSDDHVFAPLSQNVFRRIWLASLLSNFGSLIQGVGAAWAMTQMTTSADMVALVQTASTLPIMLISLPAGAIADMYDRRLIALLALAVTLIGSIALTVLAYFGAITPTSLLAFCFIIGFGMALFGPAWQSSVNEQVSAQMLPAAIALNSISYNIARGFLVSAIAMCVSPLIAIWLKVPEVGSANHDAVDSPADPEVLLALTPRSGPIVIEIEYRVDPGSARTFYGLMQHVQLNRQRNGAYGWSIARDITNPELWTERYHCPTWHDYLRQRSRPTQSERALQKNAAAFHLGPESVRIRRMLERPFGSVRWKEESPDRIAPDIISISTPSTSGT